MNDLKLSCLFYNDDYTRFSIFGVGTVIIAPDNTFTEIKKTKKLNIINITAKANDTTDKKAKDSKCTQFRQKSLSPFL